MSVNRIEQIKKHNAETIDENHENISLNNLVGLCPNHHAMIHHRDFNTEIKKLINYK